MRAVDRCGVVPDPTKPSGSTATIEYKCDFGACLPDNLHFGSNSNANVVPGVSALAIPSMNMIYRDASEGLLVIAVRSDRSGPWDLPVLG